MTEEFTIHRVEILDQMDDDHFALADMDRSNALGTIPPEEDESDLAAVVLLLDMIRDLDEDHVLVLRKEVKE